MGKESTFRDIAESQIRLYESKNADYGNAADKLYESYGLTYYLIMLEQKLLRLKNLNNKTDEANNESIEDSLLDMSNYAILAVESMRKNAKQINENSPKNTDKANYEALQKAKADIPNNQNAVFDMTDYANTIITGTQAKIEKSTFAKIENSTF